MANDLLKKMLSKKSVEKPRQLRLEPWKEGLARRPLKAQSKKATRKKAKQQKKAIKVFKLGADKNWETATGKPTYEWICLPKMQFGKYEGKPIGEVDHGYLEWVLENCTIGSGTEEAILKTLGS